MTKATRILSKKGIEHLREVGGEMGFIRKVEIGTMRLEGDELNVIRSEDHPMMAFMTPEAAGDYAYTYALAIMNSVPLTPEQGAQMLSRFKGHVNSITTIRPADQVAS